MRTVCLIATASLAGFVVAAVFITGATGQAGVNPPTGVSNGDVNGDGDLDISDAVYLLAHLFRGGSAPVACADSPELVARVSDLESTVGSLALTLASSRALCTENPDRFIENGDGTLTDRCSGLTWQKRTADTSGDGLLDFNDIVNRAQAQQYIANLQLGGHNDWRLPTLSELRALIDVTRVGPAIDAKFNAMVILQPPPGGTNVYRSASHPDCCEGNDFGVTFEIGSVSSISAEDAAFVLAVRG